MRQLWAIPVIVMAIGLMPMPYGYYNLVRFIVCGTAIYFAHSSFVKNENSFVWIFGALAILYNPILPIHLYEKEIWTVVNIITGIIFFVRRNTV